MHPSHSQGESEQHVLWQDVDSLLFQLLLVYRGRLTTNKSGKCLVLDFSSFPARLSPPNELIADKRVPATGFLLLLQQRCSRWKAQLSAAGSGHREQFTNHSQTRQLRSPNSIQDPISHSFRDFFNRLFILKKVNIYLKTCQEKKIPGDTFYFPVLKFF